MLKEKFAHWCEQLAQFTQNKRWRSLVVLVGDEHWTTQYINTSLTVLLSSSRHSQPCQGLVYGDDLNANVHEQLLSVNRKNYRQYLGTEQHVVVFNAGQKCSVSDTHCDFDFDVDAFAALTGTLVAGGVLILLLTPCQIRALNEQQSTDFFLQRFLKQLSDKHSYLIKQNALSLPELPEELAINESVELGVKTITLSTQVTAPESKLYAQKLTAAEQVTDLPYGCVTQEQVLAVDAMLKVLYGHRDRPLVLTADRGRGKSSALALAACQMLLHAKQPINIIITAASKQALKVFFNQVTAHLPCASLQGTRVEHDNGRIIFYPIDVILKERPVANIVMVDEAAALPVYLLQQLLEHYHRLIFASTVHGYEGAGRGFSIKFRLVLQRLMPNWRNLHIHQAIRWADDDPLEQFVFTSCLLNAKLPSYDNSSISVKSFADRHRQQKLALIEQENVTIESVSKTQLLQNEALLQQIFAVLVTAHYQTSPSDVKLLLNNTAISLFILRRESDILGVVMLMREGGADKSLVKLVRENQRRLRDQFLPQSLLTHCGIKDSFNYRYQRVMRIAIHPQFQGQGLGGYFLGAIENNMIEQGIDFIGASFAGNASLLKFWQQAGFNVARVGFSKDKASGEHSCIVTKALMPNAEGTQQAISAQFYQQFDYWLSDEFKFLPTKFVWQVLNANCGLKKLALSNDLEQSVNDFISGQRQFSSCVYALHQWLIRHCTEQFNTEVLPLIARILQKHSVEQVCQHYAFTGKKALNQQLIHYISAHKH
tara:strand:- start:5541 stop:7847 length:2307 start_codon:yes stop_codon:yes gene_type:complete